jgi:PAS domain S-box-containing protein
MTPTAPSLGPASAEVDLRTHAGFRRVTVPWGLVAACVSVSLALGALAETTIRTQRAHLVETERRRLEAVALLEANLVERWVAERRADAAVSARGLAVTLRTLWDAGPDAGDARTLVARLEYFRATYRYERVEIRDRRRALVFATGPGAIAQEFLAELPPIEEPREPILRWSAARAGAESYAFAIAQPLAAAEEEQPQGWLVLAGSARPFLEPLLAHGPGDRRPVGNLLVRRESGAGPAAGPAKAHGTLLERARRGERGAVEAAGAAGRPELAYLAPIPGTPWTLVATVGRDEVLAELAGVARRIRLGLFAAFALTVATGVALHRRGRAQLELRAAKAEQRLHALFAQAEEGVLLLDAKARILAANPSARRMLGLGSPTEAVVPLTDFFAPGELERQPLRLRELAERGTLETLRRLRRGGGETFPARLQGVMLPDGRILAFVRDLTEARRAEERERRAKRMAGFGTWDWEPKTGEVHWDEETFLVLGFDPSRDRPSRTAWRSRVHPDDLPRVEEAVRRALADEAVYDCEYRLVLPSGRERWVRSVADVVRDDAGAPLRLEGAVQDVTARHSADALLAAAREQLAEAQKLEAVGRLAGTVAHDFNNVIGVIAGFAELAELELDGGHPSKGPVGEIRRAAARAADQTRQLLAYARRQPQELQVVALDQLLEEVRRLLGQALGAQIRIEIDSPPGVGAVLADRAQLVQILLNLAVNARDAMPDGGRLTLRCRRVELTPEEAGRRPPLAAGGALRLEVEDSGTGMDAETVARCFEPFFTTKAPGVGTGLGLSSVKRALEICRGAIEVESAPGRGTRFTLWFPEAAGERAEAPAPEPPPPALGRGERVLVVDDLAQMRDVAGRVLGRAGFRVTLETDPLAALARLGAGAEPFDLLLTDIVMPILSGRDLAARARALDPGLPVLFMTGYAGLQTDGRDLDLPGEQVIQKPFTGPDLVRRVRAALDARAGDQGR